jgi:hypothetical protein
MFSQEAGEAAGISYFPYSLIGTSQRVILRERSDRRTSCGSVWDSALSKALRPLLVMTRFVLEEPHNRRFSPTVGQEVLRPFGLRMTNGPRRFQHGFIRRIRNIRVIRASCCSCVYFLPRNRILAVNARPSNVLNVSNPGESTLLFTNAGFLRAVAFSSTPRSASA